jgi:cytochrome c553
MEKVDSQANATYYLAIRYEMAKSPAMTRLLRAALLPALLPILPLAFAPNAPARADETQAATGKAIYAERCEQCHGRRATQRALGVSKILIRVPDAEIVAKLRAHQDGPPAPDAAMKDKMKSGLAEGDIESLRLYIDSLRP